MSRMYQALLHLQQRPRPQPPASRPGQPPGLSPGQPPEGALDLAGATQSPRPTSHEGVDASHAAQGALERAARLLEAHEALPSVGTELLPDQLVHATASPLQPQGASPGVPAGATPPEDPCAAPSEAVQRVMRLLDDPLRAAPVRALAQRLAIDRQVTGCRSQWLVAVRPSQGIEDVALGAAACLARSPDLQAGQVLLVDAELRHRRLSQALGYGDRPGLVECLLGRMPGRGLCRPTGLAHLWLLPAGQGAGQARAFVAASDLVAAGWAEAVAAFQTVLVCGAAADDPWASALAPLADAAYVVAELGRVDAPAAQAALARLRAHGARVLGCIAIEPALVRPSAWGAA